MSAALTAQEYWWSEVAHGRVSLQRCTDCETWRFPPDEVCWSCWSPRSTWVRVSGQGRIVATVALEAHDAVHGELVEGPRITAVAPAGALQAGDAAVVVARLIDGVGRLQWHATSP